MLTPTFSLGFSITFLFHLTATARDDDRLKKRTERDATVEQG
jgi:hypothetical protein